MENQEEELLDFDSIDSHHESTLQMYTPAMMAEMLSVSVRAIRLWSRAGLIQPAKVVMKVPYFDYSVLTIANRLAQWMHQGLTARSLVKQLSNLAGLRGGDLVEAAELPLILEGKRLVLSDGSMRIEASGQLQFCFESTSSDPEDEEPITLKFVARQNDSPITTSSNRLLAMLDAAAEAEDEDDLETATRWYHAVLAEFGPNAEVCFHLAEILYRQADLGAARERYRMALELEPGLVEARANLGCVLAEYGQNGLAIEAFQTALKQYPDYADAHFHLARSLDIDGRAEAAVEHWRRFVELAPASPWSDEAVARLSEPSASLLER